MNSGILLRDMRHILISKRTAYTIIFFAVFAVSVAVVTEYSPENLKKAIEAGAPGLAGAFEYIWFEDVMVLFLPVIAITYGVFMLSDLEDEDVMGLLLSRSESRLSFLIRRMAVATASFLIVFIASCILVAAIATALVGNLNVGVFLAHHMMLIPMCLFILGLTFFLSVPLRTMTPTALTSFAICLALYFIFTILILTGNNPPSPLNPMTISYRILVDTPVAETVGYTVVYTCVFFITGSLWFMKKDI